LAAAAAVGILLVSGIGLVWAVREPAGSVTSPGTVLVNPVAATAMPGSPAALPRTELGRLDTRAPFAPNPTGRPDQPVAPANTSVTVADNTPVPASSKPDAVRSPGTESTLPAEAKAPPATVEAAPPSTEPRAAKNGTSEETCVFNFNTIPASEVVVDGVSLGFTPKRGVTLAAGNHGVVFTSQDGDKRMTNASCSPGETKTISGRLRDLPAADDLPASNPYR
jgi:hypothetical protein